MIIKPKVRGFICTTAHPQGCAESVQEQIDYVKQHAGDQQGPKNVLVIGCSTGYGLASRITTAFSFGANTLGVMFEKEPTERKTATAGWYNTRAFEDKAAAAGLYAESLNMDAFSHEAKTAVIEKIKAHMGKVDLVVYSLASPRRKDPDSGEIYSSTLKPVGKEVTRKTLNTDSVQVHDITLPPATEEEIAGTIKVMGGADWELWMDALMQADVLSDQAKTTAYTYIGKSLTMPIYGEATIGKAKEDLDRAAKAITAKLQSGNGGDAYVSVLKAIVTQSSSAIPVMPLYISLLYRVMKDLGTHEGCIEQIQRLFEKQMYNGNALDFDENGRVRIDDWEMSADVQKAVFEAWPHVTTETFDAHADFAGYQTDFMKNFGFGLAGIDYEAPTEVERPIEDA